MVSTCGEKAPGYNSLTSLHLETFAIVEKTYKIKIKNIYVNKTVKMCQ